MARTLSIRVRPAIFVPKGEDAPIGVVRFLDPDDGSEFFMIDAAHAAALIASIQAAVLDATTAAEVMKGYGPDDLRLMVSSAEGRA